MNFLMKFVVIIRMCSLVKSNQSDDLQEKVATAKVWKIRWYIFIVRSAFDLLRMK